MRSLSFSVQCGSCWAFSVVGAVQSVHAIGGSQLVELSVQQVLDCSVQNKGCNGGTPVAALKWLTQVCGLFQTTRLTAGFELI